MTDTARHLVSIARLLCGEDRSIVFEPLVADWVREWTDARGARRARVLIEGASAYLYSLAQCLDVVSVFKGRPFAAFATTVLVFAIAGAVASLQPVHITWVGWGPRFIWVPPPPVLSYFVPGMLAAYGGFALLPATLFAARAGWSWRSSTSLVLLTVSGLLFVEGWIHPAALRARSQHAIAGMPVPGRSQTQDIRSFTSTSRLVAVATSDDPVLAPVARAALWDKAWWLALALSSAMLGAAGGSLARRRRWHLRVRTAALWWALSALFYWAVGAWAWALVMLLELPRGAGFWMPSAALLLVAALVVLAGRRMRGRPEVHT